MTRYLLPLLLLMVVSCGQEPQTFEELRAAGQRAFGTGNYPQARVYLGQALAQKPSDRDLLYLVGVTYQRDRMFDSAIVYLKRADILYPQDREINLALADVCTDAGDWINARHALETLVAGGEAGTDYLEELLRVSIKAEQYHFAYYYARKLLELFPDEESRYLTVANLAAALDSEAVAINVVDSALERFGATEESLVNKARLLAMLGEYGASERLYRTLIAMDTASIEHKINLANMLDLQDDQSKKREAYDILSRLDRTYNGTVRLDSLLAALREELGITAPE